jgi:hypothetical protein
VLSAESFAKGAEPRSRTVTSHKWMTNFIHA